jgi:major type 1 subunit fimbrin (pilin)
VPALFSSRYLREFQVKKNLISAALAAAAAFVVMAPSAYAADGTINFNGAITGTTCTITSGTGGVQGVTLPTVSASTLNGAVGKVNGLTAFQIQLSNCTPATGNVHAHWEATNIDPSTGNVQIAASSTATGVEIQLMNTDGTVINAANDDSMQNSHSVAIQTDGSAMLPYAAQYYSTATAVGVGPLTAQVMYDLSYN